MDHRPERSVSTINHIASHTALGNNWVLAAARFPLDTALINQTQRPQSPNHICGVGSIFNVIIQQIATFCVVNRVQIENLLSILWIGNWLVCLKHTHTVYALTFLKPS